MVPLIRQAYEGMGSTDGENLRIAPCDLRVREQVLSLQKHLHGRSRIVLEGIWFWLKKPEQKLAAENLRELSDSTGARIVSSELPVRAELETVLANPKLAAFVRHVFGMEQHELAANVYDTVEQMEDELLVPAGLVLCERRKLTSLLTMEERGSLNNTLIPEAAINKILGEREVHQWQSK
jgi:hypothetical protein